MDSALLAELTEASGPPGAEDRVREIVRRHLGETTDRVDDLAMGCLDGVRAAAGTSRGRLMLAAHMDEIGLMITHVDDRGFASFVPLGGWDARTRLAAANAAHGQGAAR